MATIKGLQLSKGDRVTFRYSDPHKTGIAPEIRVGTVDRVTNKTANAICMVCDDRKAFRSFSEAFITDLLVL